MNKCFFIGRLVNDPEISSYKKMAKVRQLLNID